MSLVSYTVQFMAHMHTVVNDNELHPYTVYLLPVS